MYFFAKIVISYKHNIQDCPLLEDIRRFRFSFIGQRIPYRRVSALPCGQIGTINSNLSIKNPGRQARGIAVRWE